MHAKRYEPMLRMDRWGGDDEPGMREDPRGEYVAFSDYHAVETRRAEATRLLCLTRSALGNRAPLLNAEVDSFLAATATVSATGSPDGE